VPCSHQWRWRFPRRWRQGGATRKQPRRAGGETREAWTEKKSSRREGGVGTIGGTLWSRQRQRSRWKLQALRRWSLGVTFRCVSENKMVVPPRERSTPPASISVAGKLIVRWRGEADRGDRWRHPGVVGRDREMAWLLIQELLGFRLIPSRSPLHFLHHPFLHSHLFVY